MNWVSAPFPSRWFKGIPHNPHTIMFIHIYTCSSLRSAVHFVAATRETPYTTTIYMLLAVINQANSTHKLPVAGYNPSRLGSIYPLSFPLFITTSSIYIVVAMLQYMCAYNNICIVCTARSWIAACAWCSLWRTGNIAIVPVSNCRERYDP